jgi:hypothetical protein
VQLRKKGGTDDKERWISVFCFLYFPLSLSFFVIFFPFSLSSPKSPHRGSRDSGRLKNVSIPEAKEVERQFSQVARHCLLGREDSFFFFFLFFFFPLDDDGTNEGSIEVKWRLCLEYGRICSCSETELIEYIREDGQLGIYGGLQNRSLQWLTEFVRRGGMQLLREKLQITTKDERRGGLRDCIQSLYLFVSFAQGIQVLEQAGKRKSYVFWPFFCFFFRFFYRIWDYESDRFHHVCVVRFANCNFADCDAGGVEEHLGMWTGG